ncbi:MAG: ATP-binding protein [Flavobacteriales bacterium]|nr:ATP-binding protein [Flavobacteriales bacterium]
MAWKFYGRNQELEQLDHILDRERWAFVKISGRRRIGKTTLIEETLKRHPDRKSFYVQIPDSEPAGVLEAVHGFMEAFDLDRKRPTSLLEFAQLISELAEEGYIVVLDEFQYFHRKVLEEFQSFLQSVVDRCSSRASEVKGCLIVLGSIHAEMTALLDDRRAPLFNRITDRLDLGHLDIGSVLEILRAHAQGTPQELLFYWNLFEGVPKFYRDCFEQGVLGKDRATVLRRMFFESSSPLRNEAENWFLHELRGRYNMVLKFIAQKPGCVNGDIEARLRELDPAKHKQAGGYLKILMDNYQMVERRLPIFAKPNARSGRYYISDNFLRSWLYALAIPAATTRFKPLDALIAQADGRLQAAEGYGLERLVATIYEERGRKGLPGFTLSKRIEGYWDRGDVEIDLVALNDEDQVIRFGSCKRDPDLHTTGELGRFDGHIERFLIAFPKYRHWTMEKTAITTEHTPDTMKACATAGYISEDLVALTNGL